MKKAVFVTGGSTGAGLAVASRFAREGYDVFVTSRKASLAEAAAKCIAEEFGVFARGFGLDIGDEQRVKDIFAEIDGMDRLVETVVLNAADAGTGEDPAKGPEFFEQPVEDFRQVLETNLVWNFTIIRQAALRMRQQRKGAVVFISSNAAYRAIPNQAAFCASKGGMLSLSKALAVDLGPYGIRSNVVLPGTIKSKHWINMGSKQVVTGEMTPLGDISEFDDVANAVWFLGSDESRNVTGAEIVVDGGMSSQLFPTALTELKKGEPGNWD